MSLLLPHRQLLLPKKPFLVGVTTQTSTGTPITLTLPRRESGILVVALICRHAGGTAAPGTPTGWTSLLNTTVDPDMRIAYKFCNGSEAPTATSGAASATSMSAIVFAFSGVHSSVAPIQAGVVATTSSTPNPGASGESGFNGRNSQYVPYAMWNGDANVIGYPDKYTIAPTTIREGANGGMAAIMRYADVQNEDASAFTLDASVVNRAGIVGVAGF